MPSPKNGNAGTPVPPANPQAASEAATAAPGALGDAQGNPLQTQPGKYDSAPLKPFKPPTTKAEKRQKNSWIEIEMVDEEENPVPGEKYRVTLPDGATVAEGTLDEKGFARVEGFEPGNCKVTFPDLDQGAWEEA